MSVRKPKNFKPIPKQRESDVVIAISQWLTARGIPHWRINCGALPTQQGQLVRFGAKGMSDFYAIASGGKSIWIECKRPEGGTVSEHQKRFLDCINQNGGIGIVVTSIESLEAQLKGAGVI